MIRGKRNNSEKMEAKKIQKKEKVNSTRKSSTLGKDREFMVITYSFLALFLGLIAYFSYFQIVKSEDFINNSYNTRLQLYEETVTRGNILASSGEVLATTIVEGDKEVRNYPYASLFSHVVGYNSNEHGRAGVESWANFNLIRSNAPLIEKVVDDVTLEKYMGDEVVTTLELKLQQTAYNALGDYDGAVVVLEPSTGKILAMVSKPDFDPNTIDTNWDTIVADEEDESALVNRASLGLYPPGSTFKSIMVLEYLREKGDDSGFTYTCTGNLVVDSSKISCYNGEVHGKETLLEAFAESCNCAFSSLGLSSDLTKLNRTAKELLFNTSLPVTDLDTKKSSFVLNDDSSSSEIMETSIGQGQTLVTPLHMAMITSAIVNDGILMQPYVIDYTQTYNKTLVKSNKPKEYGSLMSESEAVTLQNYMKEVVSNGTGSKLNGGSYTAAGKTGSAEYGTVKGESHAWFIGYGNQEGKEDIAIAVIMEGAGIGSTYAVPVAKSVFDEYFSE